jgi:hemerythrin
MNFIWDPKYSVNIRSIDTQHQKFFEIINQIYFLLRQPSLAKKDLLKVIDELQKYAEFHLSYEEKCFKDFNYPDAKTHLAAHNTFRKQVKEFSGSLKKSNTDINVLAETIADFTKNWLSQHILDFDHHYISFFIMHDIK